MILVHALSHVKLNPNNPSAWNDQNPSFTKEFYKNLRILSQDLYKKSATTGLSTVSSTGLPMSTTTRETSFQRKRASLISMGSSGHLNNRSFKGGLQGLKEGFPSNQETTPRNDLEPVNPRGTPVAVGGTGTDPEFHLQSITDRIQHYVKDGIFPSEFLDRYADILKSRGS